MLGWSHWRLSCSMTSNRGRRWRSLILVSSKSTIGRWERLTSLTCWPISTSLLKGQDGGTWSCFAMSSMSPLQNKLQNSKGKSTYLSSTSGLTFQNLQGVRRQWTLGWHPFPCSMSPCKCQRGARRLNCHMKTNCMTTGNGTCPSLWQTPSTAPRRMMSAEPTECAPSPRWPSACQTQEIASLPFTHFHKTCKIALQVAQQVPHPRHPRSSNSWVKETQKVLLSTS